MTVMLDWAPRSSVRAASRQRKGRSRPLSAGAWLGGGFAGIFGLTAVLGYVAPLGFAPLVALGGLACVGLVRQARMPLPVIWPWLALTIWAVVSMAWTPAAPDPGLVLDYPDVEKITALKLVFQTALYSLFVFGASRLTALRAERAVSILSVGVVLLALVLLVEAIQGAALYQSLKASIGDPIRPDLAVKNVAQASYVLTLLCWPAALCLVGSRYPGAGRIATVMIFFGLFTGASLMSADASVAGLALGAAVFVAIMGFGAAANMVLIAAAVAYWILTPLLVLLAVDHRLFAMAHQVLGASWDARLDIWSFSAAQIMQHPFFGWGLDASRSFETAIPLHTHDGALQVWLELGAVGAGLMATAWVVILSMIQPLIQRDRPLGAVAAASAAAYLMIGAVSFGVWQEWWLALGALTFAVIAALARARSDRR